MVEYIKFSNQDKNFGERDFLQSQLELLNIIKRLNKYKDLRKHELLLKVALKSKLDKIIHSLSVLDKILPRIKFQKDDVAGKIPIFKTTSNFSLEQEVELIKRKLALLSN